MLLWRCGPEKLRRKIRHYPMVIGRAHVGAAVPMHHQLSAHDQRQRDRWQSSGRQEAPASRFPPSRPWLLTMTLSQQCVQQRVPWPQERISHRNAIPGETFL